MRDGVETGKKTGRREISWDKVRYIQHLRTEVGGWGGGGDINFIQSLCRKTGK